jgi:glucose-6-phosphate 1-dehydrogenase
MGENLALNVASHERRVALWNHNPEKVARFLDGHGTEGQWIGANTRALEIRHSGQSPVSPLGAAGALRLLLDVMQGNQTLFTRADWVDKAWAIVDSIVDHWAADAPADFPNYAAGSAGPEAALELLRRDNREWRSL